MPDIRVFNMGRGHDLKVHCFSKAIGDDLLSLDFGIVPPFLESIWQGREMIKVDDYELTVVSLSGLKEMKRMSGRPHDLADVERLEELERDGGDK